MAGKLNTIKSFISGVPVLIIFNEGTDNPKIGISRGVFNLYAAIFTIIKSPGYKVLAIEEVGIRKAPKKNALTNIARITKKNIKRINFFIKILPK
jgi:hypothetical protein